MSSTPELFQNLSEAEDVRQFLRDRNFDALANDFDELINALSSEESLEKIIDFGSNLCSVLDHVEGVLKNERE